MAIALERSRVTARSARILRVRRVVGLVLTWATIIAALIFFLGPFFWILTTSLKANEDYFAYPPVWVPADASLKHYAALFTRSSGALYFTNSLVISTLSMARSLGQEYPYSKATIEMVGEAGYWRVDSYSDSSWHYKQPPTTCSEVPFLTTAARLLSGRRTADNGAGYPGSSPRRTMDHSHSRER